MFVVDNDKVNEMFNIINDIVKTINIIGLDERYKSIDGLVEALKYLKVLTKYTVFDLEATSRERDICKRIIDGGNNG